MAEASIMTEKSNMCFSATLQPMIGKREIIPFIGYVSRKAHHSLILLGFIQIRWINTSLRALLTASTLKIE
jgi:hypothetical protein